MGERVKGSERGAAAGASGAGNGRAAFSLEEALGVLTHFDVGRVKSIREYPRGSRKAPKLRISAELGQFLLKRRAKGKDDPFKVAFAHALQVYLAERQFPLPHLIGTKEDGNSMLASGGYIYELFEYIAGNPYDESLEATFDAGKILALYHKLLREYESPYEASAGSYHQSSLVRKALEELGAGLRKSGVAKGDAEKMAAEMRASYLEAGAKAESLGLNAWPTQIVHCDWHPGNMLFRNNRVVAVIDYDAARMQPRVLDIANGALQFSMLTGSAEIREWPEYADESRFKRFVRGYDEVDVVSLAELQAVPWLMVEAMVAESVLPIAGTGFFGDIPGGRFLEMIQRKIAWVRERAEMLVAGVAR